MPETVIQARSLRSALEKVTKAIPSKSETPEHLLVCLEFHQEKPSVVRCGNGVFNINAQFCAETDEDWSCFVRPTRIAAVVEIEEGDVQLYIKRKPRDRFGLSGRITFVGERAQGSFAMAAAAEFPFIEPGPALGSVLVDCSWRSGIPGRRTPRS